MSRRAAILVPLYALLLATPTVAAEEFRSEELQSGESYTHTFDAPGNFTIHDHKNPNVEGAVTVVADTDGTTDQVNVQIRDDDGEVRFEPATVTIEAGDAVRWTNSGSDVHQVMGWGEGDEMSMGDGHDDHGEHGAHTHEMGDTGESPGPAALLVIAVALGLLGRRRAGGAPSQG